MIYPQLLPAVNALTTIALILVLSARLKRALKSYRP